MQWSRILAEGSAIVVSILLAFSIDAWWQRQIERRDADALVTGLYADFRTSQAHIEEWLAGNERTLRAANEFLAALRSADVDERLTVPHTWIVAAVVAPTYSPTDTSLRIAVATGQFELIEDDELRNTLALWRQQLEDTQEDELLIREIVVSQVVPLLSEQVRLGRAFEFDPLINWFTGREKVEFDGEYELRVTAPLESALAERVFYTNFVVEGLTAIRDTQTDIIQLLETRTHGRQ